MRIAYPMRVDALDKPGGDLFQVQKYIEAGARKGSNAHYEGVILTNPNSGLASFDIIHLTNIDRPVDTYWSFIKAKAAKKPIVISTIHHSYNEIERYERLGRGGLPGHLTGLLGFNSLEYLRSLIRCGKYPALLPGCAHTVPWKITDKQKEMLEGSEWILVLSEKEKNDILSEIAYVNPDKFVLLRNGIEPVEAGRLQTPRDIDVCMVGRIEARKNQIAVLRALNRIGITGIFVGAENMRHGAFVNQFRDLIDSSSSRYIGPRSHSETLHLMARSRVHISASWFEVSSLVDLEAYASGCMVVASSCGGTREILGDCASYVDPNSIPDIERGIKEMLARANLSASGNFQTSSLGSGLATWGVIGNKLHHLYSTLLSPSLENTLESGLSGSLQNDNEHPAQKCPTRAPGATQGLTLP